MRLLEAVTEAADAPVLERLSRSSSPPRRPWCATAAPCPRRGARGGAGAGERVPRRASGACRNRALAVDAGAAREAIELELDAWSSPQARGGAPRRP